VTQPEADSPKALTPPKERSVYINCPFDEEFKQVFDAILLATLACGFIPRSALETETTSISRMERIANAMFASKYSIHDLSRCRGEEQENFARFNMPLELGISVALTYGDKRRSHDWFLLVTEGHAYRRFISDLAGFDPKEYGGTAKSVVPRVMSWLITRPDATMYHTNPNQVVDLLPSLNQRLTALDNDWQGETPWPNRLEVANALVHKELLAR